MSELSSYELTDFLPFSPEVYARLFTLHNEAVWPAHLLAALMAVFLAWRAWKGDGRTVALLLAVAWGFVGWFFFFERYQSLLWAAPYLGTAFFVEAALLVLVAWCDRFELARSRDWPFRVGMGLVASGMLGVPLVAPFFGRAWTGVEVFAVAPDPTVVVTLGLLVAAARPRWILMVVPVSWCVVTALTALAMQTSSGVSAAVLGGAALLAMVWRAVAPNDHSDQVPAKR